MIGRYFVMVIYISLYYRIFFFKGDKLKIFYFLVCEDIEGKGYFVNIILYRI